MSRPIFIAALMCCVLLSAAGCSGPSKGADNPVIENIMNRKSVRQYTSQSVSADQVQTLLRAAMAAPTARNLQPWRFVVVENRAMLDTLASRLPYARMLTSAPLAIVVCGETVKPDGTPNDLWEHDCSAATENLLLAAESMGLGAVWTAAYPYEERYSAVKEALGIPETVMPLCVVPVGYPAGNDRPKDKFKPENIHYGRW